MRRQLLILFMLIASIGDAFANTLTLAEPLDLRAGPGARHSVVATAPAGAEITILKDGAQWTRVSYDGRRLYAATAQLTVAPGQASAPTATEDPTCDYGYPYSGSGLFFRRPLADLRHSEPLGFLFGLHRNHPC